MSRTIRLVAFGTALWLGMHDLAVAQTVTMTRVPAPATGVDNYIHTVDDLDRTFAFYRDVIGLPVAREPGERSASERLQRLTDTRGASLRSAQLQIPGTGVGLLLTEFSGIDRRAFTPRNSDPGASTLVVTVRDLDTMLASARTFGSPVVTAGGEPMALGPGMRSVFITDPDGFYIEIVQAEPLPETNAPTASNVVLARVAFTVENIDAVLQFYRDVLGFRVTPGGAFSANAAVSRLVGIEGGEFRASFAQIQGSALEWEFVEFRAIERIRYDGRLQDPGTAAISVLVPDVRAATQAVRAVGLPIVTAGGEPAMSDTGGAVFVRDPGGLLLELIERR